MKANRSTSGSPRRCLTWNHAAGDGIGDLQEGDGEPQERIDGDERAGRLAAADDATGRNTDVFAEDVGIDGGAASAEEAAVHVADDADGGGRRP